MNSDQTLKEHLVDYYPKIRRIVQRIAKNEGIVDDLTQECVARIIEKEHLWDGNRSKLNQWINTVTRNMTLKFVTRQKKTLPLEEESLIAPEGKEFSEEHIQWVLQQFGTLPETQKNILHMKYFQKMKNTEIAETLKVSQPTVSYQLKTALQTLKKRARAEGLLAALLPWNWEVKGWFQNVNPIHWHSQIMVGVKIMSIKIIVSVVTVTALAISGLSFINNDSEVPVIVRQFKDRTSIESFKSRQPGEVKIKGMVEAEVSTSTSKKAIKKSEASDKNRLDPVKPDTFRLIRSPKDSEPLAVSSRPPEKFNEIDEEKETDKEADLELETTLKWLKGLRNDKKKWVKEKRFEDWTFKNLINIKKLDLFRLNVTDSDLHYLKGLTSLTELNLGSSKITNEGLKELSSLTSLTNLRLDVTQVTDKGLKELSFLTSLTHLGLEDTQVTDEGLKELSSLTSLTFLDLYNTQITDEGLKELSSLTSLTVLSLMGTKITDKGLKELSSLTSLTYLNLHDTQITDEGLKELSSLTSLTYLNLLSTQVTDEGVKELKKALPNCRIDAKLPN